MVQFEIFCWNNGYTVFLYNNPSIIRTLSLKATSLIRPDFSIGTLSLKATSLIRPDFSIGTLSWKATSLIGPYFSIGTLSLKATSLIRPDFRWNEKIKCYCIATLKRGHPSYQETFSLLRAWSVKRRRGHP